MTFCQDGKVIQVTYSLVVEDDAVNLVVKPTRKIKIV